MKTSVQETSIECYHAIRDEGRLSKQQSAVMEVIRKGRDYSLQEISRLTGLAINAVSGRVNELKESGVLEQAETRKCSVTGRTVRPVRLPETRQ